MSFLDQFFPIEFLAYLGWQAYLEMMMWEWPEDGPDPPDGGITTEGRDSESIAAF